MSYIKLATLTLPTSSSTITFSNIPSISDGLQLRDLVLTTNATVASSWANGFVRLNGDSGANYFRVQMIADGSGTPTAAPAAEDAFYGTMFGATGTGNIYQFFDACVTDKHTTAIMRSNQEVRVMLSMNRWANSSAVTSITVGATGNSFTLGSSFSLYGIVG